MPTAKKKQSALQNSKVQPCFHAGHHIKSKAPYPSRYGAFALLMLFSGSFGRTPRIPKICPEKTAARLPTASPFPAPVQTALHFKNFPYTSDAGEKDANVSGNFRRMRCTSPIWRLRMMQTSIALPSCEYMPVALTSVTP